MSHTDFMDIKNLKAGPTVEIMKVHSMLFEKGETVPYTVKIKEEFGTDYKEISPTTPKRKKKGPPQIFRNY